MPLSGKNIADYHLSSSSKIRLMAETALDFMALNPFALIARAVFHDKRKEAELSCDNVACNVVTRFCSVSLIHIYHQKWPWCHRHSVCADF